MKYWSMYDSHKAAWTNFSELTEPHIAEIMLGHKLSGKIRSAAYKKGIRDVE
ncbi:hypothetical protein ACJJJB_10385 [Microbulbifer sp. ANSA001]|uniref:hypothetical protein n=1 Tax=Microbulbifer sp. ANSA001 TaxID=3243358 RepID=UPI004042B89B